MFPDFFASAPVIRMHDPLARFLGASSGGLLEYRYEDAVRLAGHSCPTVACAFLMTRLALKQLYGDALPVRGDIRVEFADSQEAGVTGVIAATATLITGATADTGFKGLAGQFNRTNKLFFNRPLKNGIVRFTRLDTRDGIEVGMDLSTVPGDSRLGGLMAECLNGTADAQDEGLFMALWQDRVRRLLTEHADDAAVFLTFPA